MVFSGKVERLEGKVVAIAKDNISRFSPNVDVLEDIVDIPFMELNNASRLESGGVEANFEIRSEPK